jgi:hypothetical protein
MFEVNHSRLGGLTFLVCWRKMNATGSRNMIPFFWALILVVANHLKELNGGKS